MWYCQLLTVTLLWTVVNCWINKAAPITQKSYNQFASEQYPSAENIQSVYDFIIIGAGSAGCILANRLSEIYNWKILLLEAGSAESLDMDIPGQAPNLQLTSIDWQYLSEPNFRYGSGLINRKIRVPRGKV